MVTAPNLFALPSSKPSQENSEDTAEYPAVSASSDLDDQTLLTAYWAMLREYVDLRALRFPKDRPISILELRCGEALEAGTLCAYLGGGQDRFDLNDRVRYMGIHDDEVLIELADIDYGALCRRKLQNDVFIFSFATCLPDEALPVNDVLVLNHFDKDEYPFSEWKSRLQHGLRFLLKNGIVLATANWTDHAPDLRYILSDKCRFLCDRKNKHSPAPGEVYDHIIVAQKVNW